MGKPIYSNFLTPRILDQLSVLKSLELQVTNGNWGALPDGKIETKDSAVSIVISILLFHKVIISFTYLSGYYKQDIDVIII